MSINVTAYKYYATQNRFLLRRYNRCIKLILGKGREGKGKESPLEGDTDFKTVIKLTSHSYRGVIAGVHETLVLLVDG